MKTKRIPAAACQLQSGQVELLAGDPSPESKAPPVASILARSGKAIEHWYWGKLVNDMAGMEQLKARLPLDYCHDSGEILGYADDWEKDTGDLTCKGTLLVDQSARAAEVVQLAKAGVPYEASISFTPMAIEQLRPGQSATINGQLVEGPAAVMRRWRLTGLAVCPRGADSNTKTELSARAGGEFEVELTEGNMPENTETMEQIAARVQQELTARITDYCERFGAQGQAWALSSRPLADCYADLVGQLRSQHAAELSAAGTAHAAQVAELQASLDAKTAEATDLQARLDAVSLGEQTPASTTPGDPPEDELSTQEKAGLSPNLQRFVAAQRRSKAAAKQ